MNFPSIASAIALHYSGHFSQIPNNHILAEKLLILPNTTSLPSFLLSVLKKICLHLLILKGMRTYDFKFPVHVFLLTE